MKNKGFVLDANTLISTFLFSPITTTARAYYKAINSGTIIFSQEVLNEFTEVLMRPKFDKYLSKEDRIEVIEDLKEVIKIIPVDVTVHICRDPKDNKYLELAIEANADCIITGDQDLLVLNPFQNIPILTPAEFLQKF